MRLYSSLSHVRNVLLRKHLTRVSQLKCCVSSYTDPYAVLGISPDADKATIKSAYLKLAKLYHPDRNPDDEDAKKKFETLHNAYRSVLERMAKSSDDPNDKKEVGYDFTVDPLGVETYLPPTLVQTQAYKRFWMFLFLVLFMYLSMVFDVREKVVNQLPPLDSITPEEEIADIHWKLTRLKEVNKEQKDLGTDMVTAIDILTR